MLDWWRDAGVDTIVGEEPFDWFGHAVATPAAKHVDPPVAPIVTAVDRPLPATLEEFVAWRSGPDAPEAGWGSEMIVARGDATSDLMIAIDCADADCLLGGVAGGLFDRMLGAIGRTRETVYLAPLAVARPVGGRLRPDGLDLLTRLFRRHIELAAPKRLLIMGQAASRALIGVDTARGRGSLHPVNLELASVEAVTSWTPQFLIDRPEYKAGAWEDLQMLTRGLR